MDPIVLPKPGLSLQGMRRTSKLRSFFSPGISAYEINGAIAERTGTGYRFRDSDGKKRVSNFFFGWTIRTRQLQLPHCDSTLSLYPQPTRVARGPHQGPDPLPFEWDMNTVGLC